MSDQPRGDGLHDLDPARFAEKIGSMSDDELFSLMRAFDEQTASSPRHKSGSEIVFAKIEMLETEVERRYPGQALMPYKQWLTQNSA